MSRVDLNRNKDALLKAHKEVSDSNDKTDWVVFGYEGQSNVLKVVEKGDGGVEEMVDELNSGKIMYAYLRVLDPNTSLHKYVFINWQGEGVPEVKKGSAASHVRDVKDFFRGAHVSINARTEDDVDEDTILDKVSKSSGSNYSFHKEAPKADIPEAGPVGSVYKKTLPHAEIKISARDKFWQKQQEEENERREFERRKSVEEKHKLDTERKQREEQEAANREKRELERNKMIREIKNAEKRANAPSQVDKEKWEETQREALRDEEERAKRSEMARKNRQAEAASLASKRTGNVRAMFEPNAVTSQFDEPASENPSRGAPPPRKLRHGFQPENESSNAPTRKAPIQLPTAEPEFDNPSAQFRPKQPVPEPVRHVPSMPKREPVREPSPEPVREPSPEPVREPSPEPVREPSPEPPRHVAPAIPTSPVSQVPASMPQTRNLLKDGLPPRQDSDEEEEDQDWGEEESFNTVKRAPSNRTPAQPPQPAYNEPPQHEAEPEEFYENIETSEPVSPEAAGLQVRALYDYQAEDDSEISFDPDDIITNVEQIDEGWWTGTGPDGRHGMFPANYVEVI